MNRNKSPLIVSSDYEVVSRKREKAYPVLISDWEYLKKKIDNIQPVGLFFHTLGSVLLGVAGAAFFAIVTLKATSVQTSNYSIMICGMVLVGTFIGGLLTLYIASQERKTTTGSKSDVFDEMIRIENSLIKEQSGWEKLGEGPDPRQREVDSLLRTHRKDHL